MENRYGVEFREGLPSKESIAGDVEVAEDALRPHTLLILDDLMSSSNQQVVADIFTTQLAPYIKSTSFTGHIHVDT